MERQRKKRVKSIEGIEVWKVSEEGRDNNKNNNKNASVRSLVITINRKAKRDTREAIKVGFNS